MVCETWLSRVPERTISILSVEDTSRHSLNDRMVDPCSQISEVNQRSVRNLQFADSVNCILAIEVLLVNLANQTPLPQLPPT